MMICEQMDEIMLRMISGEATTIDHEAFDAHVPSCSRCQNEWIAFQHAEATFRALSEQPENILPVVDVPKGMVEAALAAYDQQIGKQPLAFGRKKKTILYPIVGGLVAASIIGLFVFQMDQGMISDPTAMIDQEMSSKEIATKSSVENKAQVKAMTEKDSVIVENDTQMTLGANESTLSPTNEANSTQANVSDVNQILSNGQPPEKKPDQKPSTNQLYSTSNNDSEFEITDVTGNVDGGAVDPTYQVLAQSKPVVFWVDKLNKEAIAAPKSLPAKDMLSKESIDTMATYDVSELSLNAVSDLSVEATTMPNQKPQMKATSKPIIKQMTTSANQNVTTSQRIFANGNFSIRLVDGKLTVIDSDEKQISASPNAFSKTAVIQSVSWIENTGTLEYVIVDTNERISGSLFISYLE